MKRHEIVMGVCVMALSEVVAMEAAYRALHDLDVAGRRRALRWLTDALEVTGLLPETESAGAADALPDTAVPAVASAPRATSRRAPARKGAAADRPTTRRRARATTAAVQEASPTRRGRQRRAAAARTQVAEGQRAYRRMPPAEEVMAAYQQTGTLTGVAGHFDVPRHTVQGWARRLRKEGHAIGRNA
jgi:hypothetical protein